ncbi:MAG: HAD-IIIA family hydrolase [Clostridia bacterium]|nr:HAD-IIIA family hydrolase [Clostridia bacterium]
MKAVIMAGGFGRRISDIFPDIPKPMIPVCSTPVLEYQINNLKEFGITDIIITVHHMSEKIIGYFGDGSKFGVSISYFNEDKPLGTGGAVFKLKDMLREDFLLINGDLIFDIDFSKFIEFHKSHNALVTLAVHPNSHPGDSELVICRNDTVTDWIKNDGKRHRNLVNAGIHIISSEIFNYIDTDKDEIDLRKDIVLELIKTERVFAYRTAEYIKDMGTEKRYKEVCRDVKGSVVSSKRSDKKQRAVFLDRDGTLNKENGYILSPDEIKLLPGVGEAVRLINESGMLAVLVTNQPQIARGELSFDGLEKIHSELEIQLSKNGAYLDAIYFCPHHPDKGFDGEVTELKIDCNCRKPKSGMLIQAADELNIDLSQSYMIGDKETDAAAGNSAGCKRSFIVSGKKNLLYFVKDEIP